MVVSGQTRAILWAQLRTFRNFQFRSGRAGLILSLLVGLVWYGVWAVAAFAAYALLREAEDVEQIRRILTPGLLLVCLYWQLIPVLMANAGMSLQIKRLLVYPIPRSQLFGLEVLLRFSTALELVILLIGACAGILFSKVLPLPCVLGFLPLVAMNLLFSAGIRDLLARVFASRKYRELATLLVVLMATLPQLALRMGIPGPWKRLFTGSPNLIWPWTATSYLATGDWHWRYWLAIALWTYAAYLFGRRQFDRNLRFDEQAANSTDTRAGKLSPLADL
ncbi:MAG: hypothetical protein HYZ37_11155, partial [Candidatus Solibacter usitatus]|nr:hypothetical protein [Candidatus Solibacter usitatus]